MAALIDRLDAVVFDVGNVLYRWDPRYLYARLIDDPARLEWFLANVVTHDWHFQHDRGRPSAETVSELVARFPAERGLIEAYVPRWLETFDGPMPGMIELVDELAGRAMPLYAITNFSAEFWPRFRASAPVFRHFRDVVVSGEERLVKPGAAIYALAIARFGIDPAATLFIDDRRENVAAAEAAGMIGHVFTSADAVRARLSAGQASGGGA